ncbi:MAG: WbqC family protein [Defluviitaleaceae bacterium]|nr:WbqC family protein [Defluviitaleaceae bacterium]
MKTAIHQLEFLPWTGFFHKMSICDVFVLFDIAQYNKQDYQNRNVFNCHGQKKMLTVPIKTHRSKELMKNIRISNDIMWQKSFKNKMYSYYRGYMYFDVIIDIIKPIWESKWKFLFDLNLHMIEAINNFLRLKKQIVLASDIIPVDMLTVFYELSPSEKNLYLCKRVETKIYITGKQGKSYLNLDQYRYNHIKVYEIHQEVKNTTNYSIIDSLLRNGHDYKKSVQNFGFCSEIASV